MQQKTILTINKEELSKLPAEQYAGKVVVINDASEAENAISKLYNADKIGFDTESKPSFKKGVLNKVSLIQLSDGNCCYLFRINKTGLLPCIKNIIEDVNIRKIGLSIHDDFLNLNRLDTVNPAGFIDLQDYVKQFDIIDISLSKIYAILFGKRISKSQRLSNWEAETLTDAQKSYASLDASACLKIYDFLSAGKFSKDNSKYLHDYSEIFPPAEDKEETIKKTT